MRKKIAKVIFKFLKPYITMQSFKKPEDGKIIFVISIFNQDIGACILSEFEQIRWKNL